MDKKEVINILKDEKLDKRSKFSSLLMALNKAPVKNFALTAHYNRVGYSDKNLSSIEYDVKKAYDISTSELKSFKKTEAKKVEASSLDDSNSEENKTEDKEPDEEKEPEPKQESKDELELEKYNEELKAIDTKTANYNDMVSLAFDLAEQLNLELPDRKKATIIAFLEEQKKSLASEA